MSSKSPRSWLARADDILTAISALERLRDRHTLDSFLNDGDAIKLARHDLTVIGEAAKFLAPGHRERHPDIPWSNVVGLRDVIVHAYFRIDNEAIWETLCLRIPELKVAVEKERRYVEGLTAPPAKPSP